jgi:UDP-3-O-[3-hydroxymyristoyl] glucosamine N-acyltransferase
VIVGPPRKIADVEHRTISELAATIGAEVVGGGGSTVVTGVNTLEDAQPGQVSFLTNERYAPLLATTRASAVIVGPKVKPDDRLTLLRAKDAYLAYQKALLTIHGFRKHPFAGVHPQANVDPTATIGEGTVVYPGVYVGPRTRVGRDCVLYPNAVIYDRCVLGDRVILHAGAVIGADGFGYATSDGVHHKIPHIGNVVLGDDVEVGANATVDRAALGSTTVGKGTKIDNLATLGHNVRTGVGCIVVAQAGVAGSTTLGNYVVLGGQAGLAGHIDVGDQVMVGAQCGVTGDVEAKQIVHGSPHMPYRDAKRAYTLLRNLPELADRLKQLEKLAEKLKDLGGDTAESSS